MRHIQTSYTGAIGNILALPQQVQTYDGSGNLVSATQYTYDAVGNLATLGNCGSITSSNCSNWLNTQITYDGYGNIQTTTDPSSHATSFTYDATNTFLIATHNALNQSASPAVYDTYIGKPTDTYDLNGNHTQYAYNDPLDRLTQVTLPNNGKIYFSYPNTTTVVTQADVSTAGDKAAQSEVIVDGFGRCRPRAPEVK